MNGLSSSTVEEEEMPNGSQPHKLMSPDGLECPSIDAETCGSIARFNNSPPEGTKENVFARVMRVNGELRIGASCLRSLRSESRDERTGLYARRRMKRRRELMIKCASLLIALIERSRIQCADGECVLFLTAHLEALTEQCPASTMKPFSTESRGSE